MAVLLHFFFLSAFAWMLVEGLHLYSMVVKVFGSEGSKHIYYYGIGWGKSVIMGADALSWCHSVAGCTLNDPSVQAFKL